MVQPAAEFGDVASGARAAVGELAFDHFALGRQLREADFELLHLEPQRTGAVGELLAFLGALLALAA